MPSSTYLGNKLLDHVFKVASFTVPTNLYVSLHSADPGLTGANELAAANGYARVNHNTWATAASKATSNSGSVTFGPATGSAWSAATHFGIWDASSAGNFIAGGALTASKTIGVGDTGVFADGALDVTA